MSHFIIARRKLEKLILKTLQLRDQIELKQNTPPDPPSDAKLHKRNTSQSKSFIERLATPNHSLCLTFLSTLFIEKNV